MLLLLSLAMFKKCKLSNCLNMFVTLNWNVCLKLLDLWRSPKCYRKMFVQYSQKNESQRWFVIVASRHISKMLADEALVCNLSLISFLVTILKAVFNFDVHTQIYTQHISTNRSGPRSIDFIWYHLTTKLNKTAFS